MAFDVQSSLANKLSNSERAATARVRAGEKAGANEKSRAADRDDSAPSAFNTLVSEKAPTSTTPQKAAPLSRTRGLMPGQIAGHQDSVVAGSTESNKVAAAMEKMGAVASTQAGVSIDPARAGNAEEPQDKPERMEAPGVNAQTAEEASTEDARSEGTTGQEASQDEHAAAQGESESSTQDNAEGTAPQDEVAASDEATPVDVAADASTVQGAVSVVSQVSPAPVAATGVLAAAATPDGVPASTGVAAAPQAVGAGTVPGTAQPSATDADAASEALSRLGIDQKGKADEGLSALKAQEPRSDQGKLLDQNAGSDQGKLPDLDKTNSLESGARSGHDGPHLRGSVFTQVLEDFTGTQGFNRTPDLLSALDRPVAAQAQANRAADVQRPTPLQMLPIEIGMQAVRGAREFIVRLDPAELGRVEVKLHINDKGEVNASMIVERPETLQMLRRDATTLAQAFEQAGLKQGENALSFSLKGENQQGQQHNSRNSSVQDSDDAALNAQIGEIALRRVMIPNSSLDLMV